MNSQSSILRLSNPSCINEGRDRQLWRDVYESGINFVEKYLVQYSSREDGDQFRARKGLTPPPAFAKAAIMDVVNNIFQRMPDITRINGTKSYMSCLDGQNGGVDLVGSAMNYFVGMKVLPELLVMKRCGVYVDMPNANGSTLQEVVTKRIRPYLYKYTAEEIINWQIDYSDNFNDYSSVLLRESYMEMDKKFNMPVREKERYRHMYIGDDGFVHIRYFTGNEVQIDDQGNETDEEVILPIDRIPFIMYEIPHSLLVDAARYQVALLNMNSSDINYCIYSNFPFYIEQQDWRSNNVFSKPNEGGGFAGEGTSASSADGSKREMDTGTREGRAYAQGLERPGFIAPPPDPLRVSMEKQKELKSDIRMLINLSVIQLGQVQASSDSKEMDNQGLEAGLSAIGIELERGERKIAEFWSMYENAEEVATVHYPPRYSLKTDTARLGEATELMGIVSSFPSQTCRKEISKQAARTLLGCKVSRDTLDKIETEIEEAEIIVTDPEVIIDEVTAGILDKENAAKALLLPADSVKKANKEHADRLAEIQAAQVPAGGQARGVADTGNPTDGKAEKVKAADTTKDTVPKDKTRGGGK